LVILFTFLYREELTGGWRKMRYFYSLRNIIRAIEWRTMRKVGHVACMGEERHDYEVFEGVT